MVLNDPCGPRYVTDTLGKGPGSLWEASGMPPQPPGEQAGGVRLGSFSAVLRQDLRSNHSYILVPKQDLIYKRAMRQDLIDQTLGPI